jgi:hypothetical protein
VLLYLCVHLNQIGVPDLVKEPVLRQLRERGVELDFSRMRVRLTRGLVAENVNVTRKGETQGEVIYAGELQLKLDWRDLRSFKAPGLRAVTVRDGRISLPLNTGTNANPFPFKVDNLHGRLRFDGAELWTLEQLEGTCHGGRFRAAGSVANASRWVRREPKEDRPKTTAGSFRGELLRYARALDRMTFSQPPELGEQACARRIPLHEDRPGQAPAPTGRACARRARAGGPRRSRSRGPRGRPPSRRGRPRRDPRAR